jgi:channel protein (hemolysin III family)
MQTVKAGISRDYDRLYRAVIPIPFLGFADPISSWSHLAGALAAAIGTGFLMARGRGNTTRVVALGIYSVCMMFMFSMSGVYHLIPHDTVARDVMCRLDHAGIWVMIAGTFTPIHIILFRGAWRWAVLLFVWAFSITALVLEVVFFGRLPSGYLILLFLSLGWLGSLSGYLFRRFFRDPSVWLLALGGLFYSVGIIQEYANLWTPISGWVGPHEIFHIFVILGAISHWVFIYRWCHHPVLDTMTFDVAIFPGDRVVARAQNDNIEVVASSISEMKKLVQQKVKEKFHSTMQPLIRLRYRNEEQIKF